MHGKASLYPEPMICSSLGAWGSGDEQNGVLFFASSLGGNPRASLEISLGNQVDHKKFQESISRRLGTDQAECSSCMS